MSKLTFSGLLLLSLPLINFGPIPGGKLTFAHLISSGMLLTWAVRGQLRLHHRSFAFGLAFLVMLVGNVMLNALRSGSLDQFTQLFNYCIMMGVMVVAYTLAMRQDTLPFNLLEAYYRIGLVYATISLVLYVYGMFDGEFLYLVTDFFNIANTFDRGGLAGELTDTLVPRITGLSPEPSFWSIYLCTLLSVGLVQGKKLWTSSMLFLTLVLLLTIARTGMVVFAFIVLYQLYRRTPVTVVVLVSVSLLGVLMRVSLDLTEADLSITQRFDSLADGWNVFLQAPVLGVGWGGFRQHALANSLDSPVIFNYYLQVAAEGGLVGLMLLLLFLFSLVTNIQREAKIVMLAIYVAWLSAPAYNLAYVWFLFGVLLAAQRRQLLGCRTIAQPQAV